MIDPPGPGAPPTPLEGVRPAGAARRPRAFVFGIDGAPWTVLKRYAAEGVMPNLARLIDLGDFRQMDVSLPEVSSVSWSTFSTGVNPAKHGIFGFIDLQPGTYRTCFPNFAHNRAPTTWDTLSQAGRTSVIINVPDTYPARPLRGALISGFVATDLAQATYPRILLPRLRSMGYKLDVDATLPHDGKLDAFVEDCFDVLARRFQAFDYLWTQQPWDYFVATITGTDRLHHFLWAAERDPSHRYHAPFRAYYREVDRILGDLYGRLRPDDTCFIVSDHGFTDIIQEVYLNRWLEEQGYLKFAGSTPSLEALHPETKAFALDPSRIYLHTEGRYPKGSVAPGAALELRDEIAGKLRALTYATPDGRQLPVVREVFTREGLYSGAQLEHAPDLVVLSQWGFDLKGTLTQRSVFGRSLFTGMHTRDDATFFINRKGLPPRRPHIGDLSPTVLELLGVPAPSDLDGRSLLHP
jgi:predicted AlkP superfamily phosphohydrolase/phosphomutase